MQKCIYVYRADARRACAGAPLPLPLARCRSLDKSAEGHEKELKTLKEQVQDVNWQRKTEQVAAGEELMGLSTQYVAINSDRVPFNSLTFGASEELMGLSTQYTTLARQPSALKDVLWLNANIK